MMAENPFPPPPGYTKRSFDTYRWRTTSGFSDYLNDRARELSCGVISITADPGMGKTVALQQWWRGSKKVTDLSVVYVDLTFLRSKDENVMILTERFFEIFTNALQGQLKLKLRIPEIKDSKTIPAICEEFYASLNECLPSGKLCVVLDSFHNLAPILRSSEALRKVIFSPLESAMKIIYVLVDYQPFPNELINSNERCQIIRDDLKKYLLFNREDVEDYLTIEGLRWLSGSFDEIYRETGGHPALVSWIGFLAYQKYEVNNWLKFEDIRQDLVGFLGVLWSKYENVLGLSPAHLEVLERLHSDPDGCSWQTVSNALAIMQEMLVTKMVIRDPWDGRLKLQIPLWGNVIKSKR